VDFFGGGNLTATGSYTQTGGRADIRAGSRTTVQSGTEQNRSGNNNPGAGSGYRTRCSGKTESTGRNGAERWQSDSAGRHSGQIARPTFDRTVYSEFISDFAQRNYTDL